MDNDKTKQAGSKGISLKTALKIVVSLALLAYVFHSTGLEKTFAELSGANLSYVPVGVLVYLMSQLVSAYRWQFLSAALGIKLSLREFYDYYLIGMYFNLMMPGAIGGDVLRMVYLARSAQRKKREALLTLIAERGVGLVALLMITTTFCLLPVAEPVPFKARLALVALSSLGVIGYIVLRTCPVEKWVEKFPKLELLLQAKIYWQNTPLLVKSVALSLGVHACMILIHVLIARAFALNIPVLYLAVVYGVVALISVIPITQNGFGLREWGYQRLLMKVGVPAETALAFAVYWFVISTLTSLVGGLVLMKGHYKTPSPEEVETL